MSRAQARRGIRPRPALPTTGLRINLDVDSISGLADGAAVATWPDSSGNGYTAAQATTANRPAYVARSGSNFPAVRFSGTTWLDTAAPSASPQTVFILLKMADATTSQWLMDTTTNVAALTIVQSQSGRLAASRSGSNAVWAYGGVGSRNFTDIGAPWTVVALSLNSSGDFIFMLDGTVSRAETDASLTSMAAAFWRIGASGAGTSGLVGDLAQVLVYDTAMTAAQMRAVNASLRARYGLAAPISGLLTLPAISTIPSRTVTHPDVQYYPGRWNGYEYWMAMTPFPADGDENPHILVSHDGDAWTAPPGLTNPVVTQAQAAAAGYSYNSDTELLLVGSTMEMYSRYAGGGKEGISRCTSTDGVTWSAPTIVLSTLTPATILSPSMYLAADGFTRTMWTVNGSTNKMERRTSTDGVTWSAPTVCTITGIGSPTIWHMNVVYDSGIFHCLMALSRPYRLRYLTSTDGLTWAGDTKDAIPLSGTSWDFGGLYRSAFLPLGGGQWDVWVSQMNHDNGGLGDWHMRRQQIKFPRPA